MDLNTNFKSDFVDMGDLNVQYSKSTNISWH